MKERRGRDEGDGKMRERRERREKRKKLKKYLVTYHVKSIPK
jgi:hypothetical protein